jgi:alpha-amylase
VFDPRLDFVADYQNYVDAVLNYPLFYTFKNVFIYQSSMRELESTLAAINKKFKDPSVLGVFINNHDNERFLYNSQNYKNYINALAFSLLTGKS